MDSIARLVAELSNSPLWFNGLFPDLHLPPTATVEQVVASVFEHISLDHGKVTSHSVLQQEQVKIASEPREYTAALVETNFGRKIVLLQYQGNGWWSRVFDESP
jgi:hypothetical protein